MIRLNGGEMRERLEKLLEETGDSEERKGRTIKKDDRVS